MVESHRNGLGKCSPGAAAVARWPEDGGPRHPHSETVPDVRRTRCVEQEASVVEEDERSIFNGAFGGCISNGLSGDVGSHDIAVPRSSGHSKLNEQKLTTTEEDDAGNILKATSNGYISDGGGSCDTSIFSQDLPSNNSIFRAQRAVPATIWKESRGSVAVGDYEANRSNMPKKNASDHDATILIEDFPLDDGASRSTPRGHLSMSDVVGSGENPKGFLSDNGQRRTNRLLSTPEMASPGEPKDSEGPDHSADGRSPMMADFIALKLKVAELQSELQVVKHQGQGHAAKNQRLQEAQESISKLKERNSRLEGENVMLLKFLVNLEQLGVLNGMEEELAAVRDMRVGNGTIQDGRGLEEEEYEWRWLADVPKGVEGWNMPSLNGNDGTPHERKKEMEDQIPTATTAVDHGPSEQKGNPSWLPMRRLSYSSNFFTYTTSPTTKSDTERISTSSGRCRTSSDGSMILVQNMPLDGGTRNDKDMMLVQSMPLKDPVANPHPHHRQRRPASSVTTPPLRQERRRQPSLLETIKNSLSVFKNPQREGGCDSIQEYRRRRERLRLLDKQAEIDSAATPAAIPEYVQCLDSSTVDTRCSELTFDMVWSRRSVENRMDDHGVPSGSNIDTEKTVSMPNSLSYEDLPQAAADPNEGNGTIDHLGSGSEAGLSLWRHSPGLSGYSVAQETQDAQEYQFASGPGTPNRKRLQRRMSPGSGREASYCEEKKDEDCDSEEEHWDPGEYAFPTLRLTASCE